MRGSDPRSGRTPRWLLFSAVALWLGAWIGFSRYALLDDALIHLRYAEMLLRTGFMTFDGTTFSYGSSSPLYVGLLAVLTPIGFGVLLPKIVSVALYLLLLATVAHLARRADARRPLWLLLGVLLLSPMALRWLTDGMETGLAVLLALLLAVLANDPNEAARPAEILASFALGFVLVLTRVELSLAIFFAVIAAALSQSQGRLLRRHLPLALGGLGAMAALQLAFGQVLPETALAKRSEPVSFLTALLQVERSTLSALTLGAGLTALWVLSLAIGLRAARRRERLALLCANLLFPALVAVIAARGQIVQGIRYFLPIYFFQIAWNLRTEIHAAPRNRLRPRSRWVMAAAALPLVFWIYEGPAVAGILSARSQMLVAMRSQGLERLSPSTGMGLDIGFISYFSQARILDLNGLVNGRAIAALTRKQRLQRFANVEPDFVFMTEPQAQELGSWKDFHLYRICHRYPAATLSEKQTYYLAIRSDRPAAIPCDVPADVLNGARTAFR